MAFNPFESFRKHSKVVMTCLAVFCMIMFVLSTGAGGGDLLEQLSNWFAGRSKVPTVATIDGKKVNAIELQDVKLRRNLANTFMERAVAESQYGLINQVQKESESLEPMLQQQVNEFLQTKFMAGQSRQTVDRYRQYLERAPFLFQILQSSIDKPDNPKKNEQLALLRKISLILNQDRRQMNRTAGQAYFGGSLNSDEDAFNFMIWKNQADKLGIKYTTPDVNDQIKMETLNALSKEGSKAIIDSLRANFRNFSIDELYAALADEFAVRTAMSAVAGEAVYTKTAPPVALTPAESWEWFNDARTEVTLGLIDLPVREYLAQVTETPTDKELKELYEKYKNDDPDPFRATPGFKEPRKIKVEYFQASSDGPFFSKVAQNVGPFLNAMAQFGSATAALQSPLPISEKAFAFAAVPSAISSQQYKAYLDNSPSWFEPSKLFNKSAVHDSSVLRAENFAVLLGSTAGSIATNAPLLSAPLAWESRIVVREFRDRARIGATAVLNAAANPMPLGSLAIESELIPAPLSAKALKGLLAEKEREALAQRLFFTDLNNFLTETKVKAQERDKNIVQAYVNQFAHDRQFPRFGTTEPRDFFDFANDPGLEKLREAYARNQGAGDPLQRNFPMPFFFQNTDRGGVAKPELYIPRVYPGVDDNKFNIFWLSEDRDSRVVGFEKAKPQVVEAWRLNKARDKAKAAADKLAAEAQKKNADVAQLKALAKSVGGEFTELKPQAYRNPVPDPLPGRPRGYKPFEVPPEVIRDPGDMGDQLVGLRKQPIGSTTVTGDMSKRHYVVGVLLNKKPPTQEDFGKIYQRSMERAADPDGLLTELKYEKLREYRIELLKQLRDDAKLQVLNPTPGGNEESGD